MGACSSPPYSSPDRYLLPDPVALPIARSAALASIVPFMPGFQIPLNELAEVFGETASLKLGCSFRSLKNFRIKSRLNMHCIVIC